ncbi:hypothetical protein HDA40_004572 [Hamadaea flava]|uniref:Uncharacterized protein n=1 Tax=Hamadaea flava TaxID=1742688 RepID=A0ABV8LEK7_9ACTN|nr:hypothetical protein [Hamadaea flava]MCP2326065.1 hypothetical protein [Hamadaea flava]
MTSASSRGAALWWKALAVDRRICVALHGCLFGSTEGWAVLDQLR